MKRCLAGSQGQHYCCYLWADDGLSPQHWTAVVTKVKGRRGRAHTHTHTDIDLLACLHPLWSLMTRQPPRPALTPASYIHMYSMHRHRKSNPRGFAWQQMGQFIAGQMEKKLWLMWKGKQNSVQLRCHTSEGLHCWLVMFYPLFLYRTCFT